MGFFGILAAWTIMWLGWNVGPLPHFDPGPAFVILLLGSNFIQLLLMPLIMVGQNVQSRHQEIQTEVDHKTLGYLRKINETQLQILQQLQATRDAPPLPDQPEPAPLVPIRNGSDRDAIPGAVSH
jgi:uncharacterized membrane protein